MSKGTIFNFTWLNKIAFRAGKVLYEVDRYGERVETKKGV